MNPTAEPIQMYIRALEHIITSLEHHRGYPPDGWSLDRLRELKRFLEKGELTWKSA